MLLFIIINSYNKSLVNVLNSLIGCTLNQDHLFLQILVQAQIDLDLIPAPTHGLYTNSAPEM